MRVVCEGWVRSTYKRELDVNKVPLGDWEYERAGRAHSGTGLKNPYVYTGPRRACAGGEQTNCIPQFDSTYAPQPERPQNYYSLPWNGPERQLYIKKLDEWHKARPIIGYTEYLYKAEKARIVIDE